MPRIIRVHPPRLIYHVLSRLGWTEGELEVRCKGDPEKMAIAARLRRETTLSAKAIPPLKGEALQERSHHFPAS